MGVADWLKKKAAGLTTIGVASQGIQKGLTNPPAAPPQEDAGAKAAREATERGSAAYQAAVSRGMGPTVKVDDSIKVKSFK